MPEYCTKQRQNTHLPFLFTKISLQFQKNVLNSVRMYQCRPVFSKGSTGRLTPPRSSQTCTVFLTAVSKSISNTARMDAQASYFFPQFENIFFKYRQNTPFAVIVFMYIIFANPVQNRFKYCHSAPLTVRRVATCTQSTQLSTHC